MKTDMNDRHSILSCILLQGFIMLDIVVCCFMDMLCIVILYCFVLLVVYGNVIYIQNTRQILY